MAKHDLITKDFALYVVHYFTSMLTWSKEDILSEIDRTIKEAKPADSVPVVRCKDCKHYVQFLQDNKECRCTIFSGCYDRPYPTEPDDFCSYGERRTGDG